MERRQSRPGTGSSEQSKYECVVYCAATLGGRTCNLLLFAFVVTPAIALPLRQPLARMTPSRSRSLIMHAVCFVLSLSAGGWKETGRIAALCCT